MGWFSNLVSGARKAANTVWTGVRNTAIVVGAAVKGAYEGIKNAVSKKIAEIKTSKGVGSFKVHEQRTSSSSSNAIREDQELLVRMREDIRRGLDVYERKLVASADKSYRKMVQSLEQQYPDIDLSRVTFDFEKRLEEDNWIDTFLKKTLSSSNQECKTLLYMPPSEKRNGEVDRFLEKVIGSIGEKLQEKAEAIFSGQAKCLYQTVEEYLEVQISQGKSYVRDLEKMRNDAGADKSNHEQIIADAELTLSMCRFISETTEKAGEM